MQTFPPKFSGKIMMDLFFFGHIFVREKSPKNDVKKATIPSCLATFCEPIRSIFGHVPQKKTWFHVFFVKNGFLKYIYI